MAVKFLKNRNIKKYKYRSSYCKWGTLSRNQDLEIVIANNKISPIFPMGTKLLTSWKVSSYSKKFILEGNNRMTQNIRIFEWISEKIEENDSIVEIKI